MDEIDVGKGVGDRLREQQYPCTAFLASRRPVRDSDALLYANLRAEAAVRFRDKLIRGEVALPYDPLLEEELRNYRGFLNSAGKLQIIPKEELRELTSERCRTFPEPAVHLFQHLPAAWPSSFSTVQGATGAPWSSVWRRAVA